MARTRKKSQRAWPKAALSWLRRVVPRIFPLSWMGILTLLVGGWLYFSFAEDKVDFMLLGVGLMAMLIVLLALLNNLLHLFALKWSVRRADAGLVDELKVGLESASQFRFSRLRIFPLSKIALSWDEPSDMAVSLQKDGKYWQEHLSPQGRGQYTEITRRWEISDIFGLSRVSFSQRWPVSLRIEPLPGRADVELAIRRASDEGYSHPSGQPLGELAEMRRYQPGDSVRHILWKVYARSRRLMVRSPERALAPRPAMVGFFVAGEGDEASASTARLFVEQGLLGDDFVFGADGSDALTTNRAEALDQIIQSRHFRDRSASALRAVMATVGPERRDNLIVFAPSTDGPWLERLSEISRTLPAPPTVVLTTSRLPELGAPESLPRRLLFEGVSVQNEASAFAALVQKIQQRGLQLKIIHRETGATVEATRYLSRPHVAEAQAS